MVNEIKVTSKSNLQTNLDGIIAEPDSIDALDSGRQDGAIEDF